MIDSHCHLADDAFREDLDDVVTRARGAGLTTAVCILDASEPTELSRAERVLALWPTGVCAVGIHPHHAGRFDGRPEEAEATLESAIGTQRRVRAVGEIGLDYHYDFSPRAIQQDVFRRQIRVARSHGLPVVIHTREADDDTVAILREEGGGELRGVFHCFGGDAALARRALDLGFHVSFSGIVTFRRAENVREAARLVPSDRMLVETDAPYLAPVPHRGTRNEPARVSDVVRGLAETRGETVADVTEATTAGCRDLFSLTEEEVRPPDLDS